MGHRKVTVIEDSDKSKINTKNIAVLYVDDEKENLRVLNLLMRRKFKIFIAQNAEEALDILAENKIHVILSDEKMKGMNGTELLQKVEAKYPHIIKMLLTGDENQLSIRNAMKNQSIFACINKPFDRFSLAKLFIDGYQRLIDEGYANLLNN